MADLAYSTALATAYGLREWPRTLEVHREVLGDLREQLDGAAVRAGLARRSAAAALADRLRALSPRRVLERGYCLVRTSEGTFVRVAAALATGQRLTIEFARGEADARVEEIRPGGEDGT